MPDWAPQPATSGMSGLQWTREAAGAVADLGVLAPLAVALVVGNGMSATAALMPAGLLYLLVAGVYRLPVGVQPLKALAAVAIAGGLPPETIGAASLLLGGLFVLLGLSGLLDRLASIFPLALVRGVQAAVGLLLLRSAVLLIWQPPGPFEPYAIGFDWSVALAVGVAVLAVRLRRLNITLVLVGVGVALAVLRAGGHHPSWGQAGMRTSGGQRWCCWCYPRLRSPWPMPASPRPTPPDIILATRPSG